MAAGDAKEVRQAREKVRERETAVFRTAAETGRQSREAREATQGEKAKDSEREGARRGARASA